MADDVSASIIPLHQVPPKKRARADTGRAKAKRKRKPQKPKVAVSEDMDFPSSESLISRVHGAVGRALRHHR